MKGQGLLLSNKSQPLEKSRIEYDTSLRYGIVKENVPRESEGAV